MMIVAVAAMLAGAGPAEVRHSFAECLKQASTQAKLQKLAADGFVAFARTNCATAEAPFKSALVDLDVSHGMSRKEALADAAGQVDDYYSERLENYKISLQPLPEPKKPQ